MTGTLAVKSTTLEIWTEGRHHIDRQQLLVLSLETVSQLAYFNSIVRRTPQAKTS